MQHVPDTFVAEPTKHRRGRVGDALFFLTQVYKAGLETGLRRVIQWYARRRSRHPLLEVRRRWATYRALEAWRCSRSRALADFREEKSINTIALTIALTTHSHDSLLTRLRGLVRPQFSLRLS